MEDLKIKIGKRLKKIRKDQKLSLKQMANSMALYVDPPSLSRYENGKVYQNIEFLCAFSRKYNVNPRWLLIGSDSKYNDLNKSETTREPEDIFLDLIEALENRPLEPLATQDSDGSGLNIKNLVSDSNKNYLTLIQYMKADQRILKSIFTHLHVVIRM